MPQLVGTAAAVDKDTLRSRRPLFSPLVLAWSVVPIAAALGEDPGRELESIVVTGSRIARDAFDSPSPVLVVGADAFVSSSAVTVERVLAELPQFVPTVGATSNAPGNDGQANISLRGLGASQTLVLLDGRRLTPADGRATPDVNVIPAALIESVEVLTGGASATYGSDAVAGVVNFRLRPTFDGLRFDGRWSQTTKGDGEEYTADVTAGTNLVDGRLSLLASVGYAHRAQIDQDRRSWSRYPLMYYADETGGVGPGGGFLDSGTGLSAEGVAVVFPSATAVEALFGSYGYPPGTVPPSAYPGYGVNPDRSVYTIGDQRNAGTVVNYRGSRPSRAFNDRIVTTNLASDTALQLPLERASAFLRAGFALGERSEAFLQALWADYTSSSQLGPSESGVLLMPTTNPYLPADLGFLLASRPSPDAPFRYLKRMMSLGPRIARNDRELLQFTAGIGGPVRGEWTYQAYLQRGTNERTERRKGNALTGEIEALVRAPDGGLSACGEFDLFGDVPIPATCAARVSTSATNRSQFEQTVAEASVHGPVLELPAGSVQAALGVFYKEDRFTFRSDPLAESFLPPVPGIVGPRPALAGFPAGASREGEESNTDLFAELRVPLLDDVPGARELQLGLGYRYSDYRRAGPFDSLKADVLYRPVQDLALRGSYQRAVRAPSVDELFYPQQLGQFLFQPPDPCSVTSVQRNGPDEARVEALCLAQGLPVELLPTFTYPLARVEGVSGGNPDLDAERSKSITLGAVYTPPADERLGEFRLSIDGYRIELDRAIGRWDADDSVQRCFDPRYNPDYDPGNAYCTFFGRDEFSGQIFAEVIDRNIGGIETSGVDFEAQWSRGVGPGRLAVNEVLGYVASWETIEPHGRAIERVGTVGGRGLGGAIPRWKSLLSVDYSWHATRAYTRWRYIDAMRDARYRGFTVPSRSYFDLGLQYAVDEGALRGLELRVGVDNVTDAEPPLFPSWQQANTDPSQYDVLGRRYYLGLGYRF